MDGTPKDIENPVTAPNLATNYAPQLADSDRRAHRPAAAALHGAAVQGRDRDCVMESLIASGSLALATIEGGRIAFASPGFLRLIGLASIEGESLTTWCRRVDPADRERIAQCLQQAIAGGHTIATGCHLTQAGGGKFKVLLAGGPTGPGAGSPYNLLLHPDRESRDAPAPARLPAAPARALARRPCEVLDKAGDLLVDAWLKSESLAVLALALTSPSAKESAKERLAAETALCARIRPNLRSGDVIGRSGEDGLLIAIPNLSGGCAAAVVAGRLIAMAQEPFALDGPPIKLDVNIGIALFPDDDQELSGLLAHAGAALELARQVGPNCYSLAETSLNLALQPQPMIWNDKLSVGLQRIDNQHALMLEKLRTMSHDIASCSNRALGRSGIERLKQALFADFRLEGELMNAHPDVAAAAHHTDHQRVVRNLDLLRSTDPVQATALSAQFLYEWMQTHIHQHDNPLVLSTYQPVW